MMVPEVRVISPWLAHRPRREGKEVTTVVLHATAGSSVSGAISTLRSEGLSYHYLIDKSGVIHKCAPAADTAYHAGVSFGPDGIQVNEYSVGISFVNRNNGSDPYEPEQVASAVWLVGELKRQFPSLKWVTSHAAISPGRKFDPRRFAIDEFAARVELDAWASKGSGSHRGGIV